MMKVLEVYFRDEVNIAKQLGFFEVILLNVPPQLHFRDSGICFPLSL